MPTRLFPLPPESIFGAVSGARYSLIFSLRQTLRIGGNGRKNPIRPIERDEMLPGRGIRSGIRQIHSSVGGEAGQIVFNRGKIVAEAAKCESFAIQREQVTEIGCVLRKFTERNAPFCRRNAERRGGRQRVLKKRKHFTASCRHRRRAPARSRSWTWGRQEKARPRQPRPVGRFALWRLNSGVPGTFPGAIAEPYRYR